MATILVPLDGSDFAEHALPLALGIARRIGGELALVIVHEPPALARAVGGAPMPELALDQRRGAEIHARVQRYLDDVQARLRASDGDVPVSGVVLEGAPASTLADHAHETAPALVVMTTHGRGGVSRLWLGSVTEGLLRHVDLPVVALRPHVDAAAPAAPREVHRVLVAVDGSAESETIIAPVVRVLGTAGVEYTLLRVVPPLHPIVRAVATDWEYSRDLGQEQRLANHYLQDLAERMLPLGATISLETRANTAPAAGIVSVASELGADLIAIATHARGPMGRLVFGSVADKVLRTADTPVLLHPIPAAGRGTLPAAASGEQIASATLVMGSSVDVFIG